MLGNAMSDLGCFENGGVEEAIRQLKERLTPINLLSPKESAKVTRNSR